MFVPIIFDYKLPYTQIHSKHCMGILEEHDYKLQLVKFGRCEIKVPVKSIPRILIQEVLNPFYIFQIFSITLWYWDEYWSYATCILVVSVMSISYSLYQTRTNLANISKMAKYTCTVNVMRSGIETELTEIESTELVPGDVIEIPENVNMPCDLILLTGSCIVNESMLTGESIPVIKSSLPFTNDVYDPDTDTKYTLYGGTKVI
jgi:P-type E1-E2 ATPase